MGEKIKTSGKMAMGRFILILPVLFFASLPQGVAQYFSTYNPNDELFTYEVKIVDEFIERFNDDHNTFLHQEFARKKQPYKITRTMMLVSLFNLQDPAFTDKDTKILGFFREVLNPAHPVYLSFNDTDWYAEAQAVFLHKGKLVEAPLILHVRSQGDEWSKWMITGVGDINKGTEHKSDISIKKGNVKTAPTYISTSAYATNFVELLYVLSENIVPENFFEPGLLATEGCKQFVDDIKSGKLQFKYIKNITFHFFQVPGWVFTVEQFDGKTNNSGWLISAVQQSSDEEKKILRKKLLNW